MTTITVKQLQLVIEVTMCPSYSAVMVFDAEVSPARGAARGVEYQAMRALRLVLP
jgi:hypothetical protein